LLKRQSRPGPDEIDGLVLLAPSAIDERQRMKGLKLFVTRRRICERMGHHVRLRFEDNTKEPQPQRSCDSSPSRKPKISHPKPDHLLLLPSTFQTEFFRKLPAREKKEAETPARQLAARRPTLASGRNLEALGRV
jgi:hypothetical protein